MAIEPYGVGPWSTNEEREKAFRDPADLWVSENVKVGWISEALRLPLAEALIPIVAKSLADGAKEECRRIRREMKAALDGPDFGGHPPRTIRAVFVALDRIVPEDG